MDYLILTKQFKTLNLKLIGYKITVNVLIYCPEYLNPKLMARAPESPDLVAIHHYEQLDSRMDTLPARTKELM